MADLIGVDWGTTSFRAYLIERTGKIVDRLETPDGITRVPDANFAEPFARNIGEWLSAHPEAPLIFSGMIGSRNGWHEVPYLPLPGGERELATGLAPLSVADGRTAFLVPGLAIDGADRLPDVMRGEETQIIGLDPAALQQATVVAPGTHTKWVRVSGGQITDFATYMTGEVYEALSRHTILAALIEVGPGSDGAFEAGVDRFAGAQGPRELLKEVFAARTLPLFGRLGSRDISNYISGLVIGAELRHALGESPADVVHLIGSSTLIDRYQSALARFGCRVKREPPDVAALGQLRIAEAAGLI